MTGPFRIRPPGGGLVAGPPPRDTLADYLERLLKLIPGEIVGIYLLGVGSIPANQGAVLAGWAIICFGLVIVARVFGTWAPGKGPQKLAVFVAAVSFVIWVYTMGGPFAAYGLQVQYVGSLSVLVWTYLVPYFYKGP